MKKILFTIVFVVAGYTLYAQASTNIFPPSGNVGIGTTTPTAKLHINTNGTSSNATAQFSGDMIIQGNPGNRTSTTGATLEFVIPANTDGSNPWGQARIITVAGNTTTGVAEGKLILGTRRWFDKKVGTGLTWNYGDDLVIDGTGNVGIGTTTPYSGLEVSNGAIRVVGGIGVGYSYDGAYIGWNRSASGGETNFVNNIGGGVTGGFTFDNTTRSNVVTRLMTILNNGNVGINTTDPKGYMLAVNGSAIATSMTVKLNANWPDYVFKKGYQLPSLTEVKAYIDKNQHLPDMPSAQEVERNGQNLGEMNKLLTKKVEELTLYLIQQKEETDKQNQELIKQNKVQQQQIDELKTQMAQLINHQ